MLNRRDLIRAAAALPALPRAWPSRRGEAVESLDVMTVTGPIAAEALGPTLPHEHVLVDFIGAERVRRDRYDPDEVIRVALPHLERLRAQGCATLVECTPAYIGRDPGLLKRLAEAGRLRIVTNTGYYGAGKNKYLPKHAFEESIDQLAGRWIAEWRDGIEGTGIRPGLIKIGVDAGPLSDVHQKLVRAAARAHRATGLTIAAHTGDGIAARHQLDLVEREGVSPAAFIWVHAQNEADGDRHVQAAERGAWVEFDGIGPNSIDRHVGLVQAMKARGLLGRVLISQDAGWYHVGEPGGGTFRPYTTLFAEFLPALRAAGFTEAEVRALTVENPQAALAVRAR